MHPPHGHARDLVRELFETTCSCSTCEQLADAHRNLHRARGLAIRAVGVACWLFTFVSLELGLAAWPLRQSSSHRTDELRPVL
eukprot:311822-Chlamydomonas_euryale.AAC.7